MIHIHPHPSIRLMYSLNDLNILSSPIIQSDVPNVQSRECSVEGNPFPPLPSFFSSSLLFSAHFVCGCLSLPLSSLYPHHRHPSYRMMMPAKSCSPFSMMEMMSGLSSIFEGITGYSTVNTSYSSSLIYSLLPLLSYLIIILSGPLCSD